MKRRTIIKVVIVIHVLFVKNVINLKDIVMNGFVSFLVVGILSIVAK